MTDALRTKMELGELLSDSTLFKQAAYIGGEWVVGGATLDVRNPANGEVVGQIPDLGAEPTRRAIAAAHAAFPQWRAMPAGKPPSGTNVRAKKSDSRGGSSPAPIMA